MAQRASSTEKRKVKRKTGPKSANKSPKRLLKSLPESVENIEIVQQVAGILEEMQTRVKDVKQEASKELKKLMKLYEGNYKNLEKKVHQATSEAKKQAQVGMIHILQKWHEHKEKLPEPLAKKVEKIVAGIGSKAMRTTKASEPKETPKKRPGRPRKNMASTNAKPARKRAAKEKASEESQP